MSTCKTLYIENTRHILRQQQAPLVTGENWPETACTRVTTATNQQIKSWNITDSSNKCPLEHNLFFCSFMSFCPAASTYCVSCACFFYFFSRPVPITSTLLSWRGWSNHELVIVIVLYEATSSLWRKPKYLLNATCSLRDSQFAYLVLYISLFSLRDGERNKERRTETEQEQQLSDCREVRQQAIDLLKDTKKSNERSVQYSE